MCHGPNIVSHCFHILVQVIYFCYVLVSSDGLCSCVFFGGLSPLATWVMFCNSPFIYIIFPSSLVLCIPSCFCFTLHFCFSSALFKFTTHKKISVSSQSTNVNTFEDFGFSLQQLSFLFLSADAIDVHSLRVCLPNDKKKDEEEPSNVNGHLIPSSNPYLSVIIKCSASNLSEWISVSSYSKAVTVFETKSIVFPQL